METTYKKLYIEKYNPLYITSVISPFIISMVCFFSFAFSHNWAFIIFINIFSLLVQSAIFLPWTTLNYWRQRKMYKHGCFINSVFVISIIALLLELFSSLLMIIVPNALLIIFISIRCMLMFLSLVVLIAGLVFMTHSTKKYEAKMIAKRERKLEKLKVKTEKSLYKNKMVCLKSDRNWITTILLWFFLGSFGAHRLYVGKKKYGVTTLVLSSLGVGLIIFWIPNLIDLVKILSHTYTDKYGRIVTDLK